LRDRDEKTLMDYAETADTETMREQVRILNQKLGELILLYRGQQQDIRLGRRVFNGSFQRGGRLYCHGSSFQNMPGEERRALELEIDGVVRPIVEIDYSNLHITMAYAEAGETVPGGDQYEIDGFPRGLVKVAVNTLFNAPTVSTAILAVTDELAPAWGARAA
jgi:hypothetical protein